MTISWHNEFLNFNLKYWKHSYEESEDDKIGIISFRLKCRKLPNEKIQVGPTLIAVELRKKCHFLIKDLAFKHKMYDAEILDMIAFSFVQHRVDIDSIEIDKDRMEREFNEQLVMCPTNRD